ncbi:MAG: hypothetical protein ACR2PO_18220 [Methyloligellaceae bacterium]
MERGRVIRQVHSLVLALALVVAPCAIVGVGSFQALASTSSKAVLSDDGKGPHSAHGDCHEPLQPDQSGCATDCHSWNLAPAVIALQAPDHGSDASLTTDQFQIQDLPGDGLLRARDRGTVRLRLAPLLHAGSVPVYALTQRYRI